MEATSQFDQFIEGLIEDKGFTDLPDEAHEELKKNLVVQVDDFIAARIIAALSDEDLAAFEELLKNYQDKQPDIQNFASQHIPDFTNFLTATLMEFRDVYLGMPQQQQ